VNEPNHRRLELQQKCLLTELDDGTGVVLNLETKFYHTLNATAVCMWKMLARGVSSEQQLVGSLVAEFQVGEEQASTDIALALLEFEREGFLVQQATR
jgi:hypothetical protein